MKFHTRRRYAVGISLALAAVIATSGAVFAYWTSSGSGDGSASAAQSAGALTVTVNPITGLYPGQTAQPITGTVVNAGPNTVFVRTVTVEIASVTLAEGASGTCTANDFRLADNENATVGAHLDGSGPGATAAWGGPTILFFDDPDNNQDGCKGATVNLTATVN